MEFDTDRPARSASRRGLMKGVAWAAPSVAVAMAAPAVAASAECAPQSASAIQQSFSFNGSITNWTQQRTTNAPAVEFSASYNGLANSALLVADPPSNVTSTTTLLSPAACLAPGTYTFRFNSRLYNANPRNLQLRADVISAATSASVSTGTVTFATTSGAVSSRTGDIVTVTVRQRTQVRFRYRWDFLTTGTGAGDDIAVSAPTVAKTA